MSNNTAHWGKKYGGYWDTTIPKNMKEERGWTFRIRRPGPAHENKNASRPIQNLKQSAEDKAKFIALMLATNNQLPILIYGPTGRRLHEAATLSTQHSRTPGKARRAGKTRRVRLSYSTSYQA